MHLHPKRDLLRQRISERIAGLTTTFSGSAFRFVDPRFSETSDLFAGKGASFANGRWLLKDSHLATYTSLEPETALAESLAANRYYGFPDENSTPIVLVTASVKAAKVIDLRDGKTRQRLRASRDSLINCDWRKDNRRGHESLTQALGWAVLDSEAEGILTPSSAWTQGSNLILFPDNFRHRNTLTVAKEVYWPHL